MGYDMSVRFENPNAVTKMLSFLSTIQKELVELQNTENTRFKFEFSTGNEIGAYAPRKKRENLISIHGIGIPYYAWSLCAWMAHKSEYRNTNGRPVLYYDDERLVIYTRNSDEKELRADEDGVLIHKEQHSSLERLIKKFKFGPDFEKTDELIRRIDSLYKASLNKEYVGDSPSP